MRKVIVFFVCSLMMAAGVRASDVLEYKKIGLKERVERAADDLFSDDGEARRNAALELKDFIENQVPRLGSDPEIETAMAAMGKELTRLLTTGKTTARVRAERVLYEAVTSLVNVPPAPDNDKYQSALRLLAVYRKLISEEGDPHAKEVLLGLFPADLKEPAPVTAAAAPEADSAAKNPAAEVASTPAPPPEAKALQNSKTPENTRHEPPPPTVAVVKAPEKPAETRPETSKAETPPPGQGAPAPGLTVIPIIMDQLNSDSDDRKIAGLKLTSKISDLIAPSLKTGGDKPVSGLASRIRALLGNKNPSVRRYASDAAASLKDTHSVTNLAVLLSDPDKDVSSAAREALVKITGTDLGEGKAAWINWAGENIKD